MNNASVHLPVQKSPRPPKFWIVVAALVVLLVLLLVFAPLLVLLLSLAVLVVGLLALVTGRIRWARIPNRRFAGGVAGGSFGLLLVSFVVFGLSLPTETTENPPVAGIVAPAAAEQATLASFVGQACEADHLVMTQGNESNYCNKDTTGAFVWVDQANHDQATAQAKEQADKKAAQEKAAQEKAAAEAKAKKEAQQKAAAKKAAEEKSAAEAKAKAKKEAERKAAAEADAERAAAAAEAEREAERLAEAESMVEDSAGSSAYYENCSAVRAAGAAPIYSGDPGYSSKLDRDGDGVGCEN
ncbi:excalibur calcium-binding domain-containing protein [Paeniglutamicibacter antarcticus]|uniref:Excalibur calcium-binding domain-containing protein n=1 Tax=Paeniglutamicibacter antarcticus TaxID=494023 RepID=A0ABP9TV15_9MICC